MHRKLCDDGISGANQNLRKRRNAMFEKQYKIYDDLPIFLNAQMIAGILGVSPTSAYELLNEKRFPVRWFGSRLAAPKNRSSTLTLLH